MFEADALFWPVRQPVFQLQNQQEEARRRKCMKTRMSLVSSAFMVLVLLAACGPGKYTPKPNEELYGTWTNEQNVGGVLAPQKAVFAVDEYKLYSNLSDLVPCEAGTYGIDSKWTDSEGNVWYKTFGTVTMGTYKGGRWQELDKLSKSATAWERALIPLGSAGEFNPNNYPPKIDPKLFYYRILYRAEK